MLSRVAEAIYWTGRTIERAENVARFIDVNFHLALGASKDEPWGALVATTGDDKFFKEHYRTPTREHVLEFLTLDARYPNSILSCFRTARDNARSIREIISSEMWEQINKSYLMVKGASLASVLESPHDFYTAVKQASHLFVGITYLTMTHNEAWHFCRLAHLIERADKTSRIVDVKYFILLPEVTDVGSPYDETQWAALLKSASALEMYRKRYGRILPASVVEFLLFDRKFPRSIRWCLMKAERSLYAITGRFQGIPETAPERALGQLQAQFSFAVTKEVIGGGLHEYLDDFQRKLNVAGDAISRTFFEVY
ncbi:MAG: alpha-E domain-containing protein [Myxococcales bacterium]